jgi:Fe-Mn family superoxide dismutase
VAAGPFVIESTPATEVRSPMTGGREPKPLPFDPAKLDGLSEKLLRSHWENNYIGSVRALNMISERLAATMEAADLPPLFYGGLKREELHRVGSVLLHEEYFGSLGGDGKPAGDVLRAIKQAYGSFEGWEAEFRRTAMSLAGCSRSTCTSTPITWTTGPRPRNTWMPSCAT